jgi:hypothetical protein
LADGTFISLKVGSTEFCSNLKVGGDKPRPITKRVAVSDGKLTLSSDAESYEKLLGKIYCLEFRKR